MSVSKKISAIALAMSVLPMLSQTAHAASTATVKITGQIIENACEISAAGKDVALGSVNRGAFVNNVYKGPTQTLVTLTGCGETANNVAVRVTSYGANTAAEDAAQGVTPVLFNGETELVSSALSDKIALSGDGETRTLELTPGMKIDQDKFKEGKFAAAVNLDIEYQ